MEYFDILDEQGNKTEEVKSRQEVHTKGYWHKAMYICIINHSGEILLQRRSSQKKIFPNKLDMSVGGHPASGEDNVTGIIREALEEVGIEINKSQLEYLFTFKNSYNNGNFIDNQFLDVFFIEMEFDIEKLKLQKEEVSEIKKVHYKDFEKMVDGHSEDLVPFFHGWRQLCDILNEKYLNVEKKNNKEMYDDCR